ncbi:class II aldolase/adducin family protein [Vineibacter terrae]|uniref:Class II aldolase/adducin family protein n=1 Tax=Vineibacter terrae TaxID=2586908 RepID=A0A5C8PFM5_9HYPH|nr:class II aldolase/adducin family protein [Vineibacter terrae]TXL72583.1 class II aldolase/adducin family protein [Vineibacter terrae]
MAVTVLRNARSVRDQVSPEEWQKRVDLAACYRLVHLHGMDEMIANHISTRVPGEDNAFLLNPYGLLYEQMHASCFIKVDLDGNVLFNSTELDINKAGFVIHSAVHRARHDVDCVIHTHTLAGMAVSAMKMGLLPLAQTAMRFIDVAYHDYEGPAIRMAEQERLVRNLGDREVMILRNHGLLATGASIPEAFNNIFRLERACQLQVMTLSCNTELSLPPSAVVEETNHLFKPGVRRRLGLHEWPALLRKLDGIDPSYRD